MGGGPGTQRCSTVIIPHVALHLALHLSQYATQMLGFLGNNTQVGKDDQGLIIPLQQHAQRL